MSNNKEKSNIYNVAFNDKIATEIKVEIENVQQIIIEEIIMIIKGYHDTKHDKGLGTEHIKIHLNSNADGAISIEELVLLGNSLREYLAIFKKPFIDKNGANIYEWENKDGVRFRAVIDKSKRANVSPRHTSISQTHTLTNQGTNATSIANTIITFYSDRNLKQPMKFKNLQVETYYQNLKQKTSLVKRREP